MPEKYDFCGYATKNDILCADGRTIRKDAFKDCDGQRVPLVWGHKHGSPGDVLGHAILENRPDGVYTYGYFNDTESAKTARELVRHGDVKSLSIYANQLVQKGKNVLHGMIREVSLCLAGANPGAKIEDLSFEHDADEDSDDFEALLFNGENIEVPGNRVIMHANPAMMPPMQPMIPQQQFVRPMMPPMPPVQPMMSPVQPIMPPPIQQRPPMMQPDALKHAEKEVEVPIMANGNEKTVGDVFNELTPEQKNVVYYMIGQALEQSDANKEGTDVAHNLFEGDSNMNEYIAHDMMNSALNDVVADIKKYGSLKKSYEHHMQEGGSLAHAIDTTGMTIPEATNSSYANSTGYGINGIDFMFPEARMLDNDIAFIQRDMDWVKVVLSGTRKSPFSKVKSLFANITEDEARAKGYIKGNQKKNEFFNLIKRTTEPKTIYKKQKLDRDDIVDITDFDVVQMLRGEMRTMLNEEVARAILIGDGRQVSDADKIDEDKIRPIVSDAPLFTIQATVTAGPTDEATAKNMIKSALRARKNYKGSGNPILFTTDDWLTNLMLIEDGIGHNLYRNEGELAAAMRVKDIVTVPVMEGLTNSSGNEILGIIVNLSDYNVGTNKGGEINMFDDFDIDVNQYVYLMETRFSGALVKPYSAIVLSKVAANSGAGSDPVVGG